jgi:hypothetical protein
LGKINQNRINSGQTDLESLGNINQEMSINKEIIMKTSEDVEGLRKEMDKLK